MRGLIYLLLALGTSVAAAPLSKASDEAIAYPDSYKRAAADEAIAYPDSYKRDAADKAVAYPGSYKARRE